MTSHSPAFTAPPITPEMLSLVEQIGEHLGALSQSEWVQQDLRLRRVSKIRSVQASLQIEGNTLSLEQVTAILDGKKVLGSPRDIQEVRNAIKAYDLLDKWNPLSQKDLLAAHGILMEGLVEDPGRFRKGPAGIQRGKKLVHLAPPAASVPALIKNLFSFIRTLKTHPLITSSIFHYEFEYIHPFSDGNGRLGRLWQTAMLNAWKPLFAVMPIESVVRDHQKDYYAALNKSNREVHSGAFVEFMLQVIRQTLEAVQPPVTPPVTPPVKKLLRLLEKRGALGNREILRFLKLKDRRRLRESCITPALSKGWIEYTIPEKPSSRNQQYRITPQGREVLSGKE